MKKEKETKKRKGLAITSLVLNLFFWIPVLNMIFSTLAIVFGVRNLTNIKNNPTEYGGKILSLAGVIWGAVIILSSFFTYAYHFFVYAT